MIQTNAAIYLGIVTACILEGCSSALVMVTRVPGGYEVKGSVKYGLGKGEGSCFMAHTFRDAETQVSDTSDLTNAARLAGDQIAASLRHAS